MKLIELQIALSQRGFNPGSLDGIWGRRTMAALKAFQQSAGLAPDGVPGPLTLAALMPGQAPGGGLHDPRLTWFKEATRLLGTRETPGSGSNPAILDWARDVGAMYDSDDIPWCALFVSHCIAATLDGEPLPARLLSACAWSKFGHQTAPTPGAVMVFWRKSVESGLGHVGFYAGENDRAFRVLGGNQSDEVSLAWIAKDRLLAARWPSTVPAMVPRPVHVGPSDQLSWDES